MSESITSQLASINVIEINARIADNSLLRITKSITLKTKPSASSQDHQEVTFLLLPNRSNIMGYQAIMGLDAVKQFNISIVKREDKMYACSDETIIGVETHGNISLQAINELEEELHIDSILQDYPQVFAETVSSFIHTEPMRIDLEQEFLIKAKLRMHSTEDINEIYQQVVRMKQNDIIEDSQSSFSCNVHLVPKKTGQKRMVVNFIPLNKIAIKDHYPMPNIQDLFNAIKKAKYFCALDCTEGFFQIPVLEEHRKRTAFITPHGMYQFKRCPFGFTNSPAKFQRTMNQIFEEGLYRKCVIYIDDILVFGETKNELTENLIWVLEKCDQFNVKLKKSKCQFMKERVEFLGHLISYNTIAPVPGKTDKLLEIKPTNKTDVMSILGTFNYYSRFIPNYTEQTKALRELTRKANGFEWSDLHEKAVSNLYKELQRALTHEIPDSYSTKFIDIVINQESIEVICTNQEDKLISRASLTLSTSESRYTPVEKTLMAMVLAYHKFGAYLKGLVVIKTPYKAVITTLNMRDRSERVDRLLLQLPPDANFEFKLLPRLKESEIINQLEESPEEIFYTDGACTGNGKPDCKASWAVLATKNAQLSRSGLVEHIRPSNQTAEITAVIKACNIALEAQLKTIMIVTDSKYTANALNTWIDVWQSNGWLDNKNKPVINGDLLKELAALKEKLTIRCLHVKGHSNDLNNIEVDKMAKTALETHYVACGIISTVLEIDQTSDLELVQIMEDLETNEQLQEKYVIINNRLYFKDSRLPIYNRNRLMVPMNTREKILQIAHDDPIYGGHLGIKKTTSKLMKYYWKHMRADIEKYLASCPTCQRRKNPKGPKPGLLQPIPISNIFERVHIDFVKAGCTSDTGNIYVITAIDAFSRYGYARATIEVKSIDMIAFLQEEIISKHGLPKVLISDNGPQYTSAEFSRYMKKLGIQHNFTCTYHPQSNGMDERFNGTLMKLIGNYVNFNLKDWDQKLIWMLTLYNSIPNESTGMAPYTILYGREMRTPLDLPDSVTDVEDATANHESIRSLVKENTERAYLIQKYYYDKKHKEQSFKVFDVVLKKNFLALKLSYKWVGPYIITKMIKHSNCNQPQAALLLDLERMTKDPKPVSFCDIKIYNLREDEEDITELERRELIPLPGDLIMEQTNRDYDEPTPPGRSPNPTQNLPELDSISSFSETLNDNSTISISEQSLDQNLHARSVSRDVLDPNLPNSNQILTNSNQNLTNSHQILSNNQNNNSSQQNSPELGTTQKSTNMNSTANNGPDNVDTISSEISLINPGGLATTSCLEPSDERTNFELQNPTSQLPSFDSFMQRLSSTPLSGIGEPNLEGNEGPITENLDQPKESEDK